MLRALAPVHDRLLWYVIGAAALGMAAPRAAAALQGAVPVMLAGQVAGVALTLDARRLLALVRRPWPVLAAMLVQWTVVPLAGIGLGRAIGPGVVGDGAIICAAVPAEITSSLVAVLAAGSGELAISTMATSLVLGTLLTPVWIATGLGGGAHVDRAALIGELALAVALPLVASVALRSRVPALARQATRCLDLAALSVVLVVFVAAGSARDIVASLSLLGALGVCAALQAVGYGTGLALARTLRLRRPEARALIFPIGMREFGIATAVALAVAPRSAAVAGIYGVMVMVTGPALAMWLRVGGRGRPAEGPLLHSAPR